MATYEIPNAPFLDTVFYITDTFWSDRGGTPHRGLDIDPSGSQNYPLYSMFQGRVLDVGYTASAGNYIIIKQLNDPQGTTTRYLHLAYRPIVNTGDIVGKWQLVGYEGTTGASTGIHLHLEMKYLYESNRWVASDVESDYINPATWLGIPNQVGVSAICRANPPVPPTPNQKKRRFPWVLYARKLRTNI